MAVTEVEESGAPRRDTIRRRTFLGGAAATGAVAALGLGTLGEARAENTSPTADRPGLSLAYWDGARFVPASGLAAGDASLCATGAAITIEAPALPRERRLRQMDIHLPAEIDGQEQNVVFHALHAAPSGGAHRARFIVPVRAHHGLVLGTETAAGAAARVDLVISTEPGEAKLRPGTYAMALGRPRWSLCRVEGRVVTRRTRQGFVPAEFDHVVITVAPAAATT